MTKLPVVFPEDLAHAMALIVNHGNAHWGSNAKDGIPEAPADGKQYGRQNERWTEIIPSEGALIGMTEQEVKEMLKSIFY